MARQQSAPYRQLNPARGGEGGKEAVPNYQSRAGGKEAALVHRRCRQVRSQSRRQGWSHSDSSFAGPFRL
jgi:hypothetical protein